MFSVSGGGRPPCGPQRLLAVPPQERVSARDEGLVGGEARSEGHQPPHRILAGAGQGACNKTGWSQSEYVLL